MNDFQYYTPTKVVFGRGTEEQAGQLVKEQGGTRALVHFGGRSARESGLLTGCWPVWTGPAWPTWSWAAWSLTPGCPRYGRGWSCAAGRVWTSCWPWGAEASLTPPRPSPWGWPTRGTWDLFSGQPAQDCLPVGTVLTIAAAGSEMSNSCVITNEDGWKKRGLNTDLCRPRFAVMDPELTFTLPAYQTASGCVDIIYHTMERYFSGPETVEPTDSMAEGLMRSMLELSRRVVRDPRDYDARAGIMWAGEPVP